MSDAVTGDPFRALGLPPSGALSDEDVRSAWRRIAVTTHPDREDGGDLARFSAAAAAYEVLRTPYGRGEALADLAATGANGHARGEGRQRPRRRTGGAHRAVKRPAEAGQPGGIGPGTAVRVAVAAVAAVAVAAVLGWTPAAIGLLVGALTAIGWAWWRWSGLDR